MSMMNYEYGYMHTLFSSMLFTMINYKITLFISCQRSYPNTTERKLDSSSFRKVISQYEKMSPCHLNVFNHICQDNHGSFFWRSNLLSEPTLMSHLPYLHQSKINKIAFSL